jgi:hypothetical protein
MPSALFVFFMSMWCLPGNQIASAPFLLETSDRELATGSLVQLSEDWTVRLNGREGVQAPGKCVVALRRVGAVLPPIPVRRFVLLVNGDVIPFSGIRVIDERFVLNPLLGNTKEVRLSPSQVALVWFSAPDGERHSDQLRRKLAAGQRTRDRVLLRNGDNLEGALTGVDENKVRLEVDKRKQEMPVSKIALIAMNTELASRRKPKGPYGRLVLANGGRLSLSSATADGETLTGKLTSGVPIQVRIQDVVSLSIVQGCAEYISDLKPNKIEQTPYLDAAMPPVVDGTAKDRDLRVGGSSYDKGIGMHGACRMTFDLGGAYKLFESLVGLDDITGREGSARVQVLVDGKTRKLGIEGDLTHRNGPMTVRVDVSGAKHLTLVVDFGERGDVQADVNWVDARLIKK